MSVRRALIVAALVAAAAAGCAQTAAPDAAFVSLSGEKVTTAALRGKVVVVNFWATDCPICAKEMPDMVRTYDRFHARGLEFFAVAMRYDPPNYVIAYAEKNRLPFKVALDPMGELASVFGGVNATPTTFVIDKRGNIVFRLTGEADFAKFNALIEEKLKEPI